MSLRERLYRSVVMREVFDTLGTSATRESFDLAKLSHADVFACLKAEVHGRLEDETAERRAEAMRRRFGEVDVA